VTEMTRSVSASLQSSEFEDFRFASIGDERNGMPPSVISALARLDPWLEGAYLADVAVEGAPGRDVLPCRGRPSRSARGPPHAAK
jgi:hypothetical protein